MSSALSLLFAAVVVAQAPTPEVPNTTDKSDGANNDEAAATARLRDVESRFSAGIEPSDSDVEALIQAGLSPYARVRAYAAAVLPWLEPARAVDPLITLSRDDDVRVRVLAASALTSLARRVEGSVRDSVVAASLALLDDKDDEVACGGAELLSVLRPRGMEDAFAARATAATDVRYACFMRFGAMPVRPVKLPPEPKAPLDPSTIVDDLSTPKPLPPTSSDTVSWLFIASAASAGMLIGGALPSGFVPARDVLVYRSDFTRLSRQDISFATQAGSALVVGGGLGVTAWLLDESLALTPSEEVAVAGAVFGAATAGGAAAFITDFGGGAPTFIVAGATAAGLVGGTALAATTDLSANDNALAASTAFLGGLIGGLTVFTAVPVGLNEIGGVNRANFGLGTAVASAGVAGIAGLTTGAFVEVPAARSASVAAGSAIGAGLLGGVAFVAVPKDLDVASRIAAGTALGGLVLGGVAGALVPDAWLGLDDSDEPVAKEVAPVEAEAAP